VSTSFDLYLLDQTGCPDLIALGRRGADTVIERVPIGGALPALAAFGQRLAAAVTGNSQRPSAADLTAFGVQLFEFLFRGSLRTLYDRLPTGAVSLQILSDRPEIRAIAWEYLVTPDRRPAPHRDRSVIRVQVTCGIDSPAPRSFGKKVTVLLVSADPVDQTGVVWEDVAATITRTFIAQLPDKVSIKVIEGATRRGLIDAMTRETFDIFHYFGHGEIKDNIGHLVLQDIKTGKSELISASEIAIAVAGKGVQLAILSACLSGAGNYADDFGVIATALIRAGVPAVIANQYPIPYKSISPFVGSVYTSLALDGDIDHAVASGRVALSLGLSAATGGEAVVEWGIPTLYRLADARQLFQP